MARRAMDQALVFEGDISTPHAVLFFDCPEDLMEKRLTKRGETSGRSDVSGREVEGYGRGVSRLLQ